MNDSLVDIFFHDHREQRSFTRQWRNVEWRLLFCCDLFFYSEDAIAMASDFVSALFDQSPAFLSQGQKVTEKFSNSRDGKIFCPRDGKLVYVPEASDRAG